MAYDKKNRRVFADESNGIALWEIADCLRDYRVNTEGDFDLGMLCTSPNINMMARNKPVSVAKESALTGEERMETGTNEYWGVRVNNLPDFVALNSNLARIHDVTLSYVRPYGGALSPFRVADFDGYSHNAVATPQASFPEGDLIGDWADGDDVGGSLQGIYVGHSQDPYGVDFSAMLRDPSVTLDYVLERAFPCILVTDAEGQSYFTALYHSQYGKYVPLKYNGMYLAFGDWCVKFEKPIYDSMTADGNRKPWNEDTEGLTASIFLVRSASTSQPIVSIGGGNFGDNWIKLNQTSIPGANSPAIVLGALGRSLVLRRIGIAFEATGSPLLLSGSAITVATNLYEVTHYDSKNHITIDVTVTLNGESNGYTLEYDGWTTGTTIIGRTVRFSQLYAPGMTVNGTVRVVTTDGNRSTTKTTTFTA